MVSGVRLQNLRGDTVLAEQVSPQLFAKRLATRLERSDFPLLVDLDPYGETVFGRTQMKQLISELALLRVRFESSADVGSEVQLIDAIRGMAEECATRPHMFVVFDGD